MKKLYLLCLTLLCIALAAPVHAEYSINADDFMYEHDKKALTTTVFLVLKSGSLNDPRGFNGLMNATFQSILRGTKKRSRSEHATAIEHLGADISVDVGFNRTIITLNVINENLEKAVALLAETVLQPAFRSYELKPLMNEIEAKLEQMKSNNRHLLFRTLRRKIYAGTPLEFPPAGYPKAIRSISFNQLRAQYWKFLKSENVFFAATSAVSERKLRDMLSEAFAGMPTGKAPAEPKIALKPQNGRKFYVIPRSGTATTEFVMGQLGFDAAYKDRLILETAMFSFGDDYSSRAMTELRKNKGWTYGAYANYRYLDLPRRYGGAFAFYSFPQRKFAENTILKAVELMEAYSKDGLTETELNYAKQSLKNSYPFQFVKASTRLLKRIYQRLDGAPFYSVEEYRRKVDQITLSDVKRAVENMHKPKSMVFVAVGDPRELRKVAEKIDGISKVTIIKDPMRR